jgi:hypothetical protein
MIKYITVIEDNEISLDLMGRKKIFKKDEEVNYDVYVKAYPQYFKKIGIMKGYSSYLATPTFIPDQIEEFVEKEAIRKVEISENSEIKEVDIDEIAEEIEEVIEEKFDIDIDKKDIEEIIEDVIFETEE